MSHYSRPSTNRYAPRGRSPSPSWSFRAESPPAGGSRFSSREYDDKDEPRYERRGRYRSPSPSFQRKDSFDDEPTFRSRRARSPSPPPRRSEPSCFSRAGAGGSSKEETYYKRRMEELFDSGMDYNEARIKVEREIADQQPQRAAPRAYPKEDESKPRSRQEFKEQLSAYAKRRMEELFNAGMEYEDAREIVAEEEAERNPRSKPPPRARAESPPQRSQPSFTSARDEGKPRPRNDAREPLSEFAKRRMEDLYQAGMDYETARKIVAEEEAEKSSKPKPKSRASGGKSDPYAKWDDHPNAGTGEKYQVSKEEMKMYMKKMEDLVRDGMSRAEAVRIIDGEIHEAMKRGERASGFGFAYDPPPRNYSSSRRYRSPCYRSPSPPRGRDNRYGGSRRGRDDESRYGY